MALNFYQGKDKVVKNLGRAQPNNSLLISNDRLNLYGKFSDNFMSIGEHRDLIYEDDYTQLSNSTKLNNRQTYYIIDGEPEYEHPAFINVKDESLILITNEAI